MTHFLKFNDIECEVMFRALDRPDDIAKLLSMEVTGAWVNEAREVPKAVIDMLGDRVEQYPPRMDEGCTWGGVFMDTNAPDEDHWWHELESDPPEGWTFFIQPGALREVNGAFVPNPKAENISNLNGGHNYYLKRVAGKKDSYVRVYYCNQYGYVEEGKRVHPEYVDATHCPGRKIDPDPRDLVVVGLDFGLTPSATFWSHRPNGQWLGFHEIPSERIGLKRFGEEELLPYILSNLMDYEIEMYGDPSGAAGNQKDADTAFQILEAIGFAVREAPTNDPTMRREALAAPLSRMIDGEPGLLLDPSMRVLRKGLSSKYIYKRVQVVGDERFHDKPDKNWWSHTCESAEYAMLGAGEGRIITMRPRTSRRASAIAVPASRHGWMGG